METKDFFKKISVLEKTIKILPQGSIGKKTIKGNTYYYHLYNENNKRIEKYINEENLLEFKEKLKLPDINLVIFCINM